MKLLIMQPSPASCHLGLHILLSILNTFSLCSCLNVKVQVLHPYKSIYQCPSSYSLILLFVTLETHPSWTQRYACKYLWSVMSFWNILYVKVERWTTKSFCS
jgi:hypothetical protein